MKIVFKSKIWKVGDSWVVTIPKEVRNNNYLKLGDWLDAEAEVKEESEIKQELEFKMIKERYPQKASGKLFYGKTEIAKLKRIFSCKKTRRVAGGTELEGALDWNNIESDRIKDKIKDLIPMGKHPQTVMCKCGNLYKETDRNDHACFFMVFDDFWGAYLASLLLEEAKKDDTRN